MRSLQDRFGHTDTGRMGWLARKTLDSDRLARRARPLRVAPVEVQVMGRDSLDVLLARNVSETGIGVYVPHGFSGVDLEAEVELVVTLPAVSPFLTRGVIRHTTETEQEGKHFGLEFVELATPHRRAIARYVKTRLG